MLKFRFPLKPGFGMGAVAGIAAAALVGCASLPSPTELDALAAKVVQTSFRDQGIAKVERLKQDLAQSACSSEAPPAEAVAQKIMADARAAVKAPSDGNYLGDWREGERIAQNGRGMTWTDASAAPTANGGNCYNCHQIGPAEISHGTIGPSLLNYGKARGISGTTSPAFKPIAEYTWAKLYNARSFTACSTMPRFGHMGLLNEAQLKHLMALLLDPASPVNQ